MNIEQLQAGELEQLDGSGNPVQSPESAAYTASIRDVQLPAPREEGEEAPAPSLQPTITPAELQTPTDAFTSGTLAPFEPLGASSYAPMSLPQLEGVGEALSKLTGMQMSVQDIRKAFNEGIFGTKVDVAISDMLSASENTKKDAMLSILNRGDLTVDQRLAIVRELDNANKGPDMNAAERSRLVQLNEQENAGYDEESDVRYIESLQEIASVPRLAKVETPLSPEELQQSFTEMLNLYAADAEQRSRKLMGKEIPYAGATANFLPMLTPFFGTVPVVKVMKELQRSVGGDMGMSTTAGAFLPGTALRTMREHIETLPLEQKVKAFARVLKVLQGNRAIFPTQNAHIQSYIVQNLFYKDMTGRDYIKEASPEENKAFIAAREQADRFNRQMAVEPDQAKAEALAAQRNVWMQKASDIEMQASGRLWHQYNKVTLGQWLDDMSILDFTLIAPLARSTIKVGQKGGLYGMKSALRIAPDATTKEMVSLLQDPRARKKLTDLLGEDIAETMLPAALKGAEEAGVEGMGELVSRAQRLRSEIKQTLREGSNVTAKVQREYAEELKKVFGDFTQKPMMHTTKSVFSPSADGVEVVARYGATPTKAFGTFEAAEKALAQMPIDGKIVRMTKDGKFEPAVKNGKVDQYFIEAADKRTYDSSRSAWQEALFPREQVRAPWFLPVNSAIGGKAAKTWNWFLSSPDVFGPDIFNRITSDVMRAAVVQKMHTGFVRDLLQLPKKEQYMVASLLKQGEEIPTAAGRGTTFTVEQLRTMHPEIPDSVIKSYYEARTLADEMYDLANGQMRAEYFREGVKSITSSSGHVGFGRPLQSADEAIADIKTAQNYTSLHAYDPETATFTALKRKDIDNIYSTGGKLVRMEDLIQGKGFQEATHVIVKQTDNAIRELPMNVLPRVNGYYPHMFSSNYVVYGVSKAGNKVALATAKTISDAKTMMATLSGRMAKMKDAPYTTFDFKFDRSLRDPLVVEKDVGGAIFNPTSKVYGNRSGTTLMNASKQYGDHMVDPVEALLRGMELVSHSVTKGNLIKNMEARLYNTLRLVEKETGEKIIKDPTKMVKTVDDINYVSKASKDLQKAVAYMQQIDMVRHIPDAVEQQLALVLSGSTEIFHRVAQRIAKLPLPGAKSVAADVTRLEEKIATAASKGVDPMRLLTEMGHRVMIAGNPVQQFALQMSQALMVSGIAPRELPRAISTAVPINTLVNMRIMLNSAETGYVEAYKKFLPIAAKMVGTTEAKLDKLIGVIERSGLIDTVSVHSQIRTSARAQATTRMLSSASTENAGTAGRLTMEALRKVDDASFGKLSQIGFEAGEALNRVATFTALYNRDLRRGVANLDSPAYIQKVIGEVNTLVGSMLRETSMGYQRGWLKAAFQFVAFQHKMATMMLFSKNLSFKQKIGLSVSQFLLFGSRGAAHLDAFHRALDDYMRDREAASPEEKSLMLEMYHSPAVQSALDGVVFDQGVNTLMRVVGGDDQPGFAWNRRLAPGGGSEMLVDALMELRNNPTEKVFGLSGKHGSKLLKFFDKTRRYMLASAKDMDDSMEPQERFTLLAKEGATLAFSGYNKYLQASVMKSMGGAVSETGNISMSANTHMERVLAAALGVTTEDRQAFLEATEKYYADVRANPKKHKAAMDEIADQLYKEMVAESIKLKGQSATPEAFEEMETKLLTNKAMMLSFLTPHEAEVVSEKIGDKIAEAIKNVDEGNTAEAAFVDDLTSDLRDGKFGDKEAMEWEVYLRRTPLFERYPQLMGEFREVRRQMLTYDDEEE